VFNDEEGSEKEASQQNVRDFLRWDSLRSNACSLSIASSRTIYFMRKLNSSLPFWRVSTNRALWCYWFNWPNMRVYPEQSLASTSLLIVLLLRGEQNATEKFSIMLADWDCCRLLCMALEVSKPRTTPISKRG